MSKPSTNNKLTAIDVLLIVFVYFFFITLLQRISHNEPNITAEQTETIQLTTDKPVSPHPIVILIRDSRDDVTFLVTLFLIACVITPINEEFLFRFALLGFLRDVMGHKTLNGMIAVVIISLLFASVHVRSPEALPYETLRRSIIFATAGITCATLTTIIYLTTAKQMRPRDFGIGIKQIPSDAMLGAITSIIAIPILTIANNVMSSLLPNTVTDPIPIFFIAIVFGTLYVKTNRIIAPIAAHITFNTISYCLTMAM